MNDPVTGAASFIISNPEGTWTAPLDVGGSRSDMVRLVPAAGDYVLTPLNKAGAVMFHEDSADPIAMPVTVTEAEWRQARGVPSPSPGTTTLTLAGLRLSHTGPGGRKTSFGLSSLSYTSPVVEPSVAVQESILRLFGELAANLPIDSGWTAPDFADVLPFRGPQEVPADPKPDEGEEVLWEPDWHYFPFDHVSYLGEEERSGLLKTADVADFNPGDADRDWHTWFADFEAADKEDRTEILQSVTPRMVRYLFDKGGLARVWAAHLVETESYGPLEAWFAACNKVRPLITAFQTLGEYVGDVVILYAHHPEKIPSDVLG